VASRAVRLSTLRDNCRSSIYEAPSYRAAEAAHLLKLSDPTVRAWCFGQGYDEAAALEKGMEAKAVEFVKKGAEIYSKA
jgi:phosphomethylpyrimidine synthase